MGGEFKEPALVYAWEEVLCFINKAQNAVDMFVQNGPWKFLNRSGPQDSF